MSDEKLLEELAFKYFMGTLLPDERTVLLTLLQDPSRQARFIRESTVCSVVHEWATEELQEEERTAGRRGSKATSRRLPAVTGARPSWPWAVAAAALILAAVWIAAGRFSDSGRTDRSARKVEPAPKNASEQRVGVEQEPPKIATPPEPTKEEERRKARIEEELRKSAASAPKGPAPLPAPAPYPTPSPKPEPERPSEPPATTTVAVATLDRIEGEVWILAGSNRTPAKPGQDLLAGQGLETRGEVGRASVRFPDKTRVDVGPGTLLRDFRTADGKRFLLDKGKLRTEVAKQPKDQPMVIATPHGEAKVLGTTLSLVVDDETRLEVEEGKVQLRNLAGKLVLVETGHYAVATREPDLAAKLLPVTVVFGGGVSKSDDTFVYGWPGYEDRNNGASGVLKVSDGAQGFTALIRFPNLVGSKPGQVVPKSRITSALLRFKSVNRGPDTGVPFKIYRCLKPWGEGKGNDSVAQRGEATWKSAQQGSLLWELPGAAGRADRSAELGGRGTTIDKAWFVTFDVTPFVQAWANGEFNGGFIIVGQGGVESSLSSSEDGTAANRPQLAVTFSY
jgi:FecR-like protein